MTVPFWTERGRAPERRPGRPSGGANALVTFRVLLLGLLLWASVLILLYGVGFRRPFRLAVGQRAPATIVATVDFICEDAARTEINRRQAADTILPVFTVDFGPYDAAARQLDKLFGHVAQLRKDAGAGATAPQLARALSGALDLLGLGLPADDVLALAPAGEEDAAKAALREALRAVWSAGIVSDEEKRTFFRGVAPRHAVEIREADGRLRTPQPVETLDLPEEAVQRSVARYRALRPAGLAPEAALAALFRTWLAPNLRYDAAATDEFRELAAAAVATAWMRVHLGETIVDKGERVTPDILARLRAHERREREVESVLDRALRGIGSAGLLLMLLAACAAVLRLGQPDILARAARAGLLVAVILPVLVLARLLLAYAEATGILSVPVVECLVPLALPSVLAALYLGVTAALVAGLWTAVAAALVFGSSFNVLLLGLLVAVVATATARDVRRRSRLFRAGFWIAVTGILFAVYTAVLVQQAPAVVLQQALAALVSGFGTAAVTLLLMPLIELLFDVTTDITLLELSDTRHPLLQRLAIEAPGTYHHSLMVAGLAEAAAREIGANALRVRVGAFFHDIGKLVKPEFFAENTVLRNNPHDELSPGMSRLVIMAHVKEGVRLGRQHRLPRIVLDAVEQHHGAGLMSFFYQRAVREGEGQPVSEGEYRYPGPRPRTRELAILSLADAVEAASRTLDKPSPGRLAALVDEVVEARGRDGQLDECDLTFAQLTAIKRSFARTLSSMLHGRLRYPHDETAPVQPPAGAGAAAPGGAAARPVAAGSGPADAQPVG